MNDQWPIVILVACCGLGACAPLQQAPLVYSSRLVVGLDVSANVAENQGGSISIGVKSVDSAYVPVAVSKQLDQRSDKAEKTLEVRVIEARYGEGSTAETSDDATNAERNRKIDGYFSAKQSADLVVSQLATLEKDISAQTTLITQLESLKSSILAASKIPEPIAQVASEPPAPPSARSEALKMRADDINKLNADRSASIATLTVQPDGMYNVVQVINDIDSKLMLLKNAKASIEGQLPDLKTQRQIKVDQAAQAKAEAIRVTGLSQTNKTDAMSVYGRFDSNGSGNTSEGRANLLVGKVFSTGLASQNLTEAVKLEARSRCLASGFEFAKNMPETDRKAFFENLSKACMTLQAGSTNSK